MTVTVVRDVLVRLICREVWVLKPQLIDREGGVFADGEEVDVLPCPRS